MLVGSSHFHNQNCACNGGAHGRGEQCCHTDDDNIGSVGWVNPTKANQNITANASAQGADYQHGQEEATGNSATVAYQSKKQFANKEQKQKLQGNWGAGDGVNELITTA